MSKKDPCFVIQKHDATRLHYDFRLQVGRKLKSWAVPKGPSTNPQEKRLALPTPDHALSYADFEGVIPEGDYGAGTVMVWDTGTYKNIKKKDGKIVPMSQCLKNGTIEVWLEGEKLKGGYALVKTRLPKDKGKEDKWLLIKMKDEYANKPKNPVENKPKSALTGRTLKQITRK